MAVYDYELCVMCVHIPLLGSQGPTVEVSGAEPQIPSQCGVDIKQQPGPGQGWVQVSCWLDTSYGLKQLAHPILERS